MSAQTTSRFVRPSDTTIAVPCNDTGTTSSASGWVVSGLAAVVAVVGLGVVVGTAVDAFSAPAPVPAVNVAPLPAVSTLASTPPPPPAVIAPPVTPKRVVTVTQTAPAPTVLVTVPAPPPVQAPPPPAYAPPPTFHAPPPWHPPTWHPPTWHPPKPKPQPHPWPTQHPHPEQSCSDQAAC